MRATALASGTCSVLITAVRGHLCHPVLLGRPFLCRPSALPGAPSTASGLLCLCLAILDYCPACQAAHRPPPAPWSPILDIRLSGRLHLLADVARNLASWIPEGNSGAASLRPSLGRWRPLSPNLGMHCAGSGCALPHIPHGVPPAQATWTCRVESRWGF